MIQILLVEDHQLLLDTLGEYISRIDDVRVCAKAPNLKAAGKYLEQNTNINMLLMDVSLPDGDGIEFMMELRQQGNSIPVIFLSMHLLPPLIARALEVKHCGYVAKSDSFNELENAIRALSNQQNFISSSALSAKFSSNDSDKLSTREVQVLTLIARGLTQQQTAYELQISARTIESHLRRIRKKTGLDSLSDLIRYAISHGFVFESV